MITLLVALAGGLGAACRFGVDAAIGGRNRTGLPLGTVVINVTGSFLLALLTGWVMFHSGSSEAKTVLGTGFLGGYTTFSTASVEAVRLLLAGRRRAAVVYGGGTLLCSLAAAGLGLWLAS